MKYTIWYDQPKLNVSKSQWKRFQINVYIHIYFWKHCLVAPSYCPKTMLTYHGRDLMAFPWLRAFLWASYQIQKIVGCACAGNAGNVFPATDLKGNHYLAIPACITARAVRHVGIANPRRRGKRSRHSRHMRNPQFCVSGKRPILWRCATIWSLAHQIL